MKPALAITPRTVVLAGMLLLLLLAWTLFHGRLEHPLAVQLLLNSNDPRQEFFSQCAGQSDDVVAFLNRCWATGKVAHRRLVAAFLNEKALAKPPWFARSEPLMLSATTDADMSIRELALAALASSGSPRLFECSKAQLEDVDPMVRQLGLEYMRKATAQQAVPVLMRLLDDPDPRIVTGAEVLLMRWSGEDYGVRMRLALPPPQTDQADSIQGANAEAIRKGIARRKEWWQLHAKEYPPEAGRADLSRYGSNRPPAPDFTLKDLDGKRLRLTDLRGRVVLINFWATWCPACLIEIPELVALESKLAGKVVILGVCLDGAPTEDDDAVEEADDKSAKPGQSLIALRAKVARTVKLRGINYPVLLDPKNAVGGRFDGGELPTTVILDQEGRVRRRFIGERHLAVFEAMIAEAGKPLRAPKAGP